MLSCLRSSKSKALMTKTMSVNPPEAHLQKATAFQPDVYSLSPSMESGKANVIQRKLPYLGVRI
jgi:hypothetical protein